MADDGTQRLVDGLSPDEQAELGNLEPMAAQLAGYVAPQPSPAETARLLAHLRPLVAARAAAEERLDDPEEFLPEGEAPTGPRFWLRLAWSQTALIEPAFWWASGAVLLLGLFLGALDGAAATLFALFGPVLAAGAVAYAFRPATRSLGELERACPIQPLELVYARLSLVLSFNLLVVLASLGSVWMQEPRAVLWRLVIAWLGPLMALAGVALYTTVRWGAIAGAAVPLTLWAGLVMGGLQWAAWQTGLSTRLLLDQVGPFVAQSNGVLLASALALAAGLTLFRQAGRRALEGSSWS